MNSIQSLGCYLNTSNGSVIANRIYNDNGDFLRIEYSVTRNGVEIIREVGKSLTGEMETVKALAKRYLQ